MAAIHVSFRLDLKRLSCVSRTFALSVIGHCALSELGKIGQYGAIDLGIRNHRWIKGDAILVGQLQTQRTPVSV